MYRYIDTPLVLTTNPYYKVPLYCIILHSTYITSRRKKLGILSWIRDQRTKKQGNKRTAESCGTREVAYTCRYTSGHLIPTVQSITMTELGITCPLVYLQV